MTKESRQSLEKLRGIADITNALAGQMAELLKLREAVQKAEEARARKTAMQRHRESISTAHRTKADALEMEAQARHRLATRRDNDAFSRSVARATDVTSPEHLREARTNGTRKQKHSLADYSCNPSGDEEEVPVAARAFSSTRALNRPLQQPDATKRQAGLDRLTASLLQPRTFGANCPVTIA